MTRFIFILSRFFPLIGWISNRFRFPLWHCGMNIDVILESRSTIEGGIGLRVGTLTRIFLNAGGRLKLGHSINLGRDVHIQIENQEIKIGDETGVQDRCRIYGNVTIGRHVVIGPNVFIASGSHTFAATPHALIIDQDRQRLTPDRPVIIGDDCWLGINAVIMPGVTIGKGCVIAANSVVNCDIPPYSVAAGAPAKVRKARLPFNPPEKISSEHPEDQVYFYSGFNYRHNHPQYGYPVDQTAVLALRKSGATHLSLKLYTMVDSAIVSYNGNEHLLSVGWNELCISPHQEILHSLTVRGGNCWIAEAKLLTV